MANVIILERTRRGPCAAGMELEARRARDAVPTLFDQPVEDDPDGDA